MEKKSKKGFTLLEIIVVIGLLVVIAGIFSLNIIKTLKRQETDANKNIEEQIIAAANAYVSMNPEAVEKLYNSYGYVDIPVGTLRDAGFLSEEIKNVETGENVSDDE
ncbi:MAG: type II secretion system protein, partial [Bacilli bacterium]|nr:type II secretion system protein [Bacilli bacterium]